MLGWIEFIDHPVVEIIGVNTLLRNIAWEGREKDRTWNFEKAPYLRRSQKIRDAKRM